MSQNIHPIPIGRLNSTLGSSRPGEVSVDGDAIDGEGPTLDPSGALEVLDLSPDLVRHAFHEHVGLQRWVRQDGVTSNRTLEYCSGKQRTRCGCNRRGSAGQLTLTRSSLRARRESRVPTRRSGTLNCARGRGGSGTASFPDDSGEGEVAYPVERGVEGVAGDIVLQARPDRARGGAGRLHGEGDDPVTGCHLRHRRRAGRERVGA